MTEAMNDHNSEDEFQLQPYQQRLQDVISNLATLRESASQPKKRARVEKRRGPKPTKVRLKFYLLPDGSKLPVLSKEDPAIEIHQNHGFGYPAVYYSNFKGKTHPISLDSSPEDFKTIIRSLYYKLQDKDFLLYTVDNRRQLNPAEIDPNYFKRIRYQGTVVIKINDTEIPQVPDQPTPIQHAQNIPRETEPRRPEPRQPNTAQQVTSAPTPRPVQQTTSRPVQQTTSRPVQQTTSRPVEQTNSRPVQQTNSRPVQQTISRPVQQTISTPVQQPPATPRPSSPDHQIKK